MNKRSIAVKVMCAAAVIFAIELVSYALDSSLFFSKRIIPSVWQISYFVILAVSMNLVLGYMGQLSLGHCGFMAVGAYTSALVSLAVERALCGYGSFASGEITAAAYREIAGEYRESILYVFVIFISVLIGAVLAAAAGFVCALPSMKLKGDYLSVITLGFGMVIVNVINNLSFAGGDGLSHGNASSALYKTGLGLNSVLMRKYVWLALVFTAVSVAVMYMYVSSKYGRNIRAIRDDEIAAESSGIDVVKNKITTFVLSSFFAGIAGGLYACCTKSISTVDFAFSNSGILNSVFIVVIVIFGGMGSFSGSVVSAIVLYIINYLIKQSGLQNVNGIIGTFFGYPMLCYALLLIITVMLKPDGLFSMKKGLVRRKKRRSEY